MARSLLALCCFLSTTVVCAQTQPAAPRVFQLDARHLLDTQRRVHSADPALTPALDHLRKTASEFLTDGPFSVTDKSATPPSGDKHDYLSQAPYWWPDPGKPDGLPYIRRDGKRNPDIYKIPDNTTMRRMAETVHTLAVAYYLTGDERFADRAALLLRTWFIAPQTRMNPHLKYAQAIPGINDGRGIGIIESLCLISVVDATGLLESSASWTKADDAALEKWFSDYLTWLLESANGKDESAEKNNHGTHYDLQVATFARFLGKDDIARKILNEVPAKRIAVQIEPDGRQPLELARTKAWSYSIMNVRGLMQLAHLAGPLGIDLWTCKTEDGRSIPAALDYLLPYALGQKNWPHEQINGFRPEGALILLRRAAHDHPDSPYAKLNLPAFPPTHIDHLIGPRLIANDEDRK